MIKPKLSPNNIQLVQQDVCPTCRCDYQRRNVTMIFIVVTILCTIIMLFVMYLFIMKICWPRFIRPMTYKGKNNALKKYDQFALNTSCFWGSTGSNNTPAVVQLHEIFVTKLMNKIMHY